MRKLAERQLRPLPLEPLGEHLGRRLVGSLRLPRGQSPGCPPPLLQPKDPHRGDKNDCRNKKNPLHSLTASPAPRKAKAKPCATRKSSRYRAPSACALRGSARYSEGLGCSGW